MIQLLEPTTAAATRSVAWRPRPRSLGGQRVALIENTKFNSDRLLQKIGDVLVREYGARETRMWRKRNSSVPAHDAIIEEVRKTCDVMVAGIGD